MDITLVEEDYLDLTVCTQVEDRRIRGNRRRSRRSRGEGKEQQYKVQGGSGLMWTAKYQPRCGADVVGNTAQVNILYCLVV